MSAADTSYMKEKPVLSLLLSMGIPMMLSMLINSLYNIVDGIFVARMSEDAMMAISLVYPVQNLLHSIAVGFGVGTNAVIAHLSREPQRRRSVICRIPGNSPESLPRPTVHGFRHSLYAAIPEYVYFQRNSHRLWYAVWYYRPLLFDDPHNRTVF